MTLRIGMVAGKFHELEMADMLAEAEQAAGELCLEVRAVSRVPGAMEIPLAAKRMLERVDIDGIVVLGIIERGETMHGAVMGQAVTSALIGLQLEYMKPAGMGVLGPGIYPTQVAARARPYARAAVTAVRHMLTGE